MSALGRPLCTVGIGLLCTMAVDGKPAQTPHSLTSTKVYVVEFRESGDSTGDLKGFARHLIELRLKEVAYLEVSRPSDLPPCSNLLGGGPEGSVSEAQPSDNYPARASHLITPFYLVRGALDKTGTKFGEEATTLLTYELDAVVNCRAIMLLRNSTSFGSSNELQSLVAAADQIKARLSIVASNKPSVEVTPFTVAGTEKRPPNSDDLLTRFLRQQVVDSDALRLWDGSFPEKNDGSPTYRLTGEIRIVAAQEGKISIDISVSVNGEPLTIDFQPKVVDDSIDGLAPLYADAAASVVRAISERYYARRADLNDVAQQSSDELLSKIRQLLCMTSTEGDRSCVADPAAALVALGRLPAASASANAVLELKAKAQVQVGQYSNAAETYDMLFARGEGLDSQQRLAILKNAADAWYQAEEYVRASERYKKYLSLSASTDLPQGAQPEVRLRTIRSLTLADLRLEALSVVLDTLALISSSRATDDATKDLEISCRAQLTDLIDELSADDLGPAAEAITKTLSHDPLLESQSLYHVGKQLYNAGQYDQALPHFLRSLAILNGPSTRSDPHLVLNDLSFVVSVYLQQWKYEQAKPYAAQAVSLAPTDLKPDDPELASVYANAAYVSEGLHDHQSAISFLEKALSTLSTHAGTNSLQMSRYLDDLGYIYVTEGKLQPATDAFTQAMNIRRKEFGESSNYFALSLEAMAEVFRRQDRFGEAAVNIQKALAIREKEYGEESVAVVVDLSTLSLILAAEGKLSSAETTSQRAMDINERLGANIRSRSTTLADLGLVYLYRGRYEKAEEVSLRALQLAAEGNYEANRLAISNNLGLINTFQMKYASADSMLMAAIELDALLLRSPASRASTIKNLAELRRKQGRYAESEKLYRQALQLWESSIGKNSTDYAVGLNGLGLLFLAQRRVAEARTNCTEALAIREKILGVNHWRNASSTLAIADIARIEGDFKSAETNYSRTISIWTRAETPDHPDVAASLNGLAGIRREQKRYGDAIDLCNKGLELRRSRFGLEHRDVADSLVTLGSIYAAEAELDKAIPLYESAYSIYRKGVGIDSPETLAIARDYVAILRRANRLADAERVEAELPQFTNTGPRQR